MRLGEIENRKTKRILGDILRNVFEIKLVKEKVKRIILKTPFLSRDEIEYIVKRLKKTDWRYEIEKTNRLLRIELNIPEAQL